MSVTRRGLLRAAVTGGAATSVGIAMASEAAFADPEGLLHGAQTEPQVLFRLLEYEQLAEFAYGHVAGGTVLSSTAKSTILKFLSQERHHAELVAAALAAHRKRPPSPPSSVVAADSALATLGVTGRLTNAHEERTAVHLLIAIETVGEDLYYLAIQRFSDTGLLDLAGQILASEAQHWTALSSLLHNGDPGLAVPHAFAPLVGQLRA